MARPRTGPRRRSGSHEITGNTSRTRVLRQLLLENLLIALGSAIAAIALAALSKGLLHKLPVPQIVHLLDVRAGVFAFIVAGLTTLLFGLLPALWTARSDLDAVLRRGATRGSARESRLQQVLMAMQLAVSFALLVGAVLFITSFRNVLRIDPGFALDQLRAWHGDACVRVVGITADFTFAGLTAREPTSVLFLLDAQAPAAAVAGRSVTLFVRTAASPRHVLAPLRDQLQSLHPGMPFVHVRPLDDRARPARIQWEVAAKLFTAFGVLATLLAAVGLYMVVAYMVTQRTRELGIRSALGASRAAILRLVLVRSARISVAGISAGMACSLAAARLLASQLYGVAATAVAAYAGAALLLLLVTVLASLLPALAAARLDPLAVLRED